MKAMNQTLVNIVRSALKGAKLAKFDASIAVLNESLAQGSWILRGSVKANSGFYQGISKADVDWNKMGLDGLTPEWYAETALGHSLQFGSPIRFMEPSKHERKDAFNKMTRDERIALGIKVLREHGGLKLSDEVIHAWLALVEEKERAFELLNSARPLPKVTAIGLSPKVTKTFTEMNLDLDVNSIKMAKLKKIKVKVKNPKTGEMEEEDFYIVDWSKGIVHGQSRFADSGGCEACGKQIPSNRFVPVEAHDKKQNRLISLWLGCDCAKNIFGIQDIGISKEAK